MTATAYPSAEQGRAHFYAIVEQLRNGACPEVTVHTRKGSVVVLTAERYAVLAGAKPGAPTKSA